MARGIISFVASTCLASKLVCCHFSQGLRAESCRAVLHICLRLKRLCSRVSPSLSLLSHSLQCVAQFAFRMCSQLVSFHKLHISLHLWHAASRQLQLPRAQQRHASTPSLLLLSLSLSLSLPAFVSVFYMSGCHIFSFLARLPLAIAAQFSLLPRAFSAVLFPFFYPSPLADTLSSSLSSPGVRDGS